MSPPSPPKPEILSRRLIAAMVAATLAIGVAVGAAIGPAPQPSLASGAQGRLLATTLIPWIASVRAAQRTPVPATGTAPGTPATQVPSSAIHRAAGHIHKPRTHPPVSSTPPPAASGSETSPTSSPAETEPSASAPGSAPSKPKQPKHEPGTPVKLPPITHVWLIQLDQQSFSGALAQHAADPYLAGTLLRAGTLLTEYSLLAHSELANDVALLSGQSPNAQTEQNCPTYTEVQPATLDAHGLAGGVGCVYPKATQTLAEELATGGLTWKAYLEGMDAEAPGASCRRPPPGAPDPAQGPNHAYLGFRNPFVYFDSLLEGGACAADDVDLGGLAADLAAPAGAPNLSWIVPSACHDGAPTPCSPGAPAGLAESDAFLRQTVAPILKSADYRAHGLVLITFDAGPATGGSKAASPAAPGSPKPVGALLISPFVRPNTRVSGAYNQLSILASLERLFGIPLLGHAADATVKQFGGDVYLATKKAA